MATSNVPAALGLCDECNEEGTHWRGPIIAYGTDFDEDTSGLEAQNVFDLTPTDLRHVADWFNGYRFFHDIISGDPRVLQAEFQAKRIARKAKIEKEVGKVGEIMVDAVRVNCDGDVKVDKHYKCECLQIPASHPIFQQTPTDISKRIELPVLVRRIPGSVNKWNKRTDVPTSMVPYVNQAGTFLNIGCQPERKNDFSNTPWDSRLPGGRIPSEPS
ncbi:hypothetical protein CC86DRAFT_431783 [Ophiobolus disseminans]|uniref:Uncharacterized protein n=1 Tax=Ophiobolus disseminans TaxID=1469910 RepID=A0A6A7AFA6_9PLEO|nr:hypothetical protein CC86DRAFT_431783 [Ophiobolus disseminans]